MNLTDPTIGTVVVPLLVIAVVAGIKSIFGDLHNRTTQIIAFGTGAVLYGLSFAITQGMIPEPALSYIVLAVSAIAGALSAMGFYDLAVKPLSRFLRFK